MLHHPSCLCMYYSDGDYSPTGRSCPVALHVSLCFQWDPHPLLLIWVSESCMQEELHVLDSTCIVLQVLMGVPKAWKIREHEQLCHNRWQHLLMWGLQSIAVVSQCCRKELWQALHLLLLKTARWRFHQACNHTCGRCLTFVLCILFCSLHWSQLP